MLPPGSTIGILGGGQLGRMTALAAARLGYRCHVFAAEPDGPAEQVCTRATIARFDDHAALDRFAADVDVATFEFENIPAEAVRRVDAVTPVRPRPEILEITQDRIREKDFLRSIGIATTRYRQVADAKDLARMLPAFGTPAVLKSVRMGYDGKGQVMLNPSIAPGDAWQRMGGTVGIVEEFVDFASEMSLIVARSETGAWAIYPPVENLHVNHILGRTTVLPTIAAETGERAETIALAVAEHLNLIGVLAVEMFVTRTGAVLVNELAPRPHNSGHWTIDACMTDQFEQLVRAICGLPLGATTHHHDAIMTNLLGADVENWRETLEQPDAKLHLYGKSEVQPGRKMGHVTRLLPMIRNTPPPSPIYQLFEQAMRERKQVLCIYDEYPRELCPIVLGHSQGHEKVLAYQFAGQSGSGLPPGGQWRCLWLSKILDCRLRDGPWHAGDSHLQPQGCVELVDLDVNPASPYAPKRRL